MSSHTQNFIAAAVRDAEHFYRAAGMAESTFGMKAAGDATVVDRLRRGQVTLRTVAKIEHYILNNRIFPNTRQSANGVAVK